MKQPAGNKYKNLLSNTVIFGISTFGSKVLVLLLTRLWTELLPAEVMGTADIIATTANLILPLMYLCIAESVIRFGTDPYYNRSDVFSIAILTVLVGYAILWCFFPLLNRVELLGGYAWLVMLYCIASAMRTVITNYVRSTGLVRLFAIDGIVTTVLNLGFNLLFLLKFNLGAAGYVLGTIVADALSAIGLFVLLRLHRFLRFRGIDAVTVRDMFRYALPLVPTAMFWWVTNLSDRFFVTELVGREANGIYSQAQKIPNLIMQISTFFTRAWELSAFSAFRSDEEEAFFSNVFRSYYTFIFVLASALLLLIRPFTRLLLAKEYFEAWRFSVFLLLAVSFSCLVTFLGAVYNAAKKNAMITITTFIGAVVNLALNALLIPKYGPVGAAFATFCSFFIVFVIRAIDSQKYVRIRMQPLRMTFGLILLLAQAAVALSETKLWLLWELLLFAVLLLSNLGYLLFLARRLLEMLRSRRKG